MPTALADACIDVHPLLRVDRAVLRHISETLAIRWNDARADAAVSLETITDDEMPPLELITDDEMPPLEAVVG